MSGRDQTKKPEPEGEEEIESAEEGTEELEDEYSDDLDEQSIDEFDEADEDLKVVDEALSHKDSNARALAIRRAIEERMEAKRLSKDLDYLDLDLDSGD